VLVPCVLRLQVRAHVRLPRKRARHDRIVVRHERPRRKFQLTVEFGAVQVLLHRLALALHVSGDVRREKMVIAGFQRDQRNAPEGHHREQHVGDGLEHALEGSLGADRFPGAKNQAVRDGYQSNCGIRHSRTSTS
jgi:hypothetical protein